MDFGIIAAGESSRLIQEGSLVPKPLVKIKGEPMIGRLIKIMESEGADKISVVINEDMPEVRDYIEKIIPGIRCEIKFQSAKTPSSLHTFFKLVELMHPEERFVVTTVDTIFREEIFRKFVHSFESSIEIDGLMGVTPYIDDEKPLYVKVNDDMKIMAFEDTDPDCEYVSAGVYGLNRKCLPVVRECINSGVKRLRNFQRALILSGCNLKAFNFGKVIDVDHLSDIEKAEQLIG